MEHKNSFAVGAAVFASAERLYLLDTGVGPAQRASLLAVLASFSDVPEVVLINSGCHPGLTGNNDLLDGSAGLVRRHLVPRRAS